MTDISSYELRYLEVYWRGIELRIKYPEEFRGNPYHDEKGRFTHAPSKASAKSLTKQKKSVKIDSKGKPYKYPELKLPKQEYGKVIHEINTLYYSRYFGKNDAWIVLNKNAYHFEVHDFDEYNIYDKIVF